MAVGGNAAGDEAHRGIGVAEQFVAQPQPARAGMAHRQHDVDLAAYGVDVERRMRCGHGDRRRCIRMRGTGGR
jgi:hypothetical protein